MSIVLDVLAVQGRRVLHTRSSLARTAAKHPASSRSWSRLDRTSPRSSSACQEAAVRSTEAQCSSPPAAAEGAVGAVSVAAHETVMETHLEVQGTRGIPGTVVTAVAAAAAAVEVAAVAPRAEVAGDLDRVQTTVGDNVSFTCCACKM
jgi:hypothetical protein